MRVPYKLYLLTRHVFKRSVGEIILRREYKSLFGRTLDLNNPRTFSEKLFHRMIMLSRHGNAEFTRLADKYLVRDYVKKMIGERYLPELIWHGSDPAEIPFDDLPRECIIKTNHGSGGNVVLSEDVDREEIIQKFRAQLRTNYYWLSREYHYYEIKPLVLIERLLDDGQEDGPLDYRFWCFGGRVEVIGVDNHRHLINPFYDKEWNRLPLRSRDHFIESEIRRPDNVDDMIYVAEKLSSHFDFVRVDLYNIAGKIYFGELTFTPGAGRFKFKPPEWDKILGERWQLKN